jgi:uncharacterized membrane protein YeaQ/YmgE (transglycosylase-associated protein family)
MLLGFTSLLAQSASVSIGGNDSGSQGMSIIAWLVLGLVAGFIASKIVNKKGDGLIFDIILGIVGAFVGGWIVRALNIGPGVSGLNLASLLVAVVGAVVFLIVYHMIRGTLRKV